jgi:TatD DNase family protein
MTDLFDSHAHYDHEAFDSDRSELLNSLPLSGVVGVLNSASDEASSLAAIDLAKRFEWIVASVGVHPHEASTLDEPLLERLEALLAHPKAVAVGEIGLDYYYDRSPRDVQKRAFERQLELAGALDKPVVVHSRDAAADTLEILRRFRPRCVVHCFSGSAELAEIYVKMGFYIGFTGVVSFEKARRPLLAAKAVPIDRLLIETDCPYMAPVPFRGKRSDSTMLPYIVEVLARLKEMEPQQLAKVTAANARRLYGIE